jgi:hypothetical protein
MDNVKGCYIKRIEDNVVWTKLGEAAMIILTRDHEEKVLNLNKTATYLWERCDGTKTLEELVQLLCEHYSVDEATARKDVGTFMANMKDKQLLSVSQIAA